MGATANIQILPDDVANKVAAGEVVERPASVLKELLENSFDAGAGSVAAEIEAGGRKLISVSDDGEGMNRDDALLAVERHATSKIRSAADLERVASYGFRGEALAAIASVSRFRLVTRRTEMSAGAEVRMDGGRAVDVSEVGCPAGTMVAVRDLFFNVPARRKFLRAQRTELHHLRQVFMTFALARPDAAMSLKVDGRSVHRLGCGDELQQRLSLLLGADLTALLRPVDIEREGVRVRGYAGLPSAARSDRGAQYIFVNRRSAAAPLIAYAIRRAYAEILPRDRHAAAVLFIDLPADQVDVNVHPTKREVRFRRPRLVGNVLRTALQSALQGNSPQSSPVSTPADCRPPPVRLEGCPPRHTFRYPQLELSMGEGSLAADRVDPPADGGGKRRADSEDIPWSNCRVLGLIGERYIVMEIDGGMLLVDPRAAHHRVLYERLLRSSEAGEVPRQGLLNAVSVSLPPADAARVRGQLDRLRQAGFEVSDFGDDVFLVETIPAALGEEIDVRRLLLDMVHDLDRGGRARSADWDLRGIARASSRAAIDRSARLSMPEVEQLVVNLARCRMPYTSPYGRPTVVFTGFGELDRRFGRR